MIKLKDIFSLYALRTYAEAAYRHRRKKLSDYVTELMHNAGLNHPNCKYPD